MKPKYTVGETLTFDSIEELNDTVNTNLKGKPMKTKIILNKNEFAAVLQAAVAGSLDIPKDELAGWQIETIPGFKKTAQNIINQYGEEEESRIILQ